MIFLVSAVGWRVDQFDAIDIGHGEELLIDDSDCLTIFSLQCERMIERIESFQSIFAVDRIDDIAVFEKGQFLSHSCYWLIDLTISSRFDAELIEKMKSFVTNFQESTRNNERMPVNDHDVKAMVNSLSVRVFQQESLVQRPSFRSNGIAMASKLIFDLEMIADG